VTSPSIVNFLRLIPLSGTRVRDPGLPCLLGLAPALNRKPKVALQKLCLLDIYGCGVLAVIVQATTREFCARSSPKSVSRYRRILRNRLKIDSEVTQKR
jgi:hypothetical protein